MSDTTGIEWTEKTYRAFILGTIPARVRFVSAEPLLGPLDFVSPVKHGDRMYDGVIRSLDWIIVGGESGPNCRPMDLAWARSLRDQCAGYRVAFFLKQLGGHPNKRGKELALLDGAICHAMPRAR